MKVRVVYTRKKGSCYSSGYSYLKCNFICVRLSKHTPDKVDFAHCIRHELAHSRGLDHDRMNSCATYGRVGRWREIFAWAESLPLEVVEKKSKKVPVDAKLAHVRSMLRAAMTREKRATTLRKKWEVKLKYYTKRAATPPSEPKPRAPRPPREKLTLEQVADAKGCTVVHNGGNEYEVFAKDGFNMGDGVHSRLCFGLTYVKEVLKYVEVEQCSDDCECKEEETHVANEL